MDGETNAEYEVLIDIKKLLQKLIDRFELAFSDQIRFARENAERYLGEPNSMKRRIYDLVDGKRTVSEIAKQLNTSQPNVSSHLKDLAKANLVIAEDLDGKRLYRKKLED